MVTASQPNFVAGGSITVTLQARDALGNPETSGGLSIAFALAGVGGRHARPRPTTATEPIPPPSPAIRWATTCSSPPSMARATTSVTFQSKSEATPPTEFRTLSGPHFPGRLSARFDSPRPAHSRLPRRRRRLAPPRPTSPSTTPPAGCGCCTSCAILGTGRALACSHWKARRT